MKQQLWLLLFSFCMSFSLRAMEAEAQAYDPFFDELEQVLQTDGSEQSYAQLTEEAQALEMQVPVFFQKLRKAFKQEGTTYKKFYETCPDKDLAQAAQELMRSFCVRLEQALEKGIDYKDFCYKFRNTDVKELALAVETILDTYYGRLQEYLAQGGSFTDLYYVWQQEEPLFASILRKSINS